MFVYEVDTVSPNWKNVGIGLSFAYFNLFFYVIMLFVLFIFVYT